MPTLIKCYECGKPFNAFGVIMSKEDETCMECLTGEEDEDDFESIGWEPSTGSEHSNV